MVKIDYDFYKAMKSGKISERIFHRERVKMILSSLNYKNKKVLDFGCSTGSILIPLAKDGIDVTGVDVSRYCVKKLKKYCKEENVSPKVLVSNGKRIRFRNEEFDIVLLLDVLEHVGNPQDIISEIRRVLKKNGKVFVTVPWKYHPIVQFKFLRKLLSGRQNIDDALDKPFTTNMLKRMFPGFKPLKIFLAVFFSELCIVFKKM